MLQVIEADHLNKVYSLYNSPSDRLKESITRKNLHQDFYALREVNFVVEGGQCMGIIGVNGSGKSTLLKIITGVLSPTSGSLKKHGKISALLELGAGFNNEYSGIENIYLNGAVMGLDREEVKSKMEQILAFADIGEFIHQPVKMYSSGMFVRLAFAVAIHVDPDILIVDEALAVGDLYFQAKCYRKFNEFRDMGKTILFVTHSMDSVLKYCDHVMVLHRGEKLAEGTPHDMVDLYKQVYADSQSSKLNIEKELVKDETVQETIRNDWKMCNEMQTNADLLEYGDKKAEIVDFGVLNEHGKYTNCLMQGEVFEICMHIRISQTLQELIYAYTIKDLMGIEVCGTNTMYENLSVRESPGEYKVRFRQKCILRSGHYLISLGITAFGGSVIHHRLYDLIGLEVVSERLCSGVFQPDSQISVTALS